MARLTRLRRLAKVQQSSMAVYCIEPRDKLVDQGAVNDSFRMADDSQEPRSSRDSLGSGGLYSEQPPCITAANFRAIGVADCDVIEPLRRKARILERIVNREQDTVSANRLPLISSPGLRASPSLTGYGRVARDRPRVSHWPAESSANDWRLLACFCPRVVVHSSQWVSLCSQEKSPLSTTDLVAFIASLPW
jgi:hypothetical protein